ncbi:MAG TPA: ROK family protein [Bacteroidota bacterium]|nr:ROK family protein [Bacteroidota bacterium]
MKTIALDLGGTRIKVGIVEGNTLLARSTIDAFSNHGLESRLPQVERAILELMRSLHLRTDEMLGIGISMPGIIDVRRGRVLSVNQKYFDAVSLDLKAWAQNQFGLPLCIENDARAALIGEWQYGAGLGIDNIVMVTLGTGVGGAAMIDGKLLHGKHFQAGCLGGHFTINYLGQPCNCGNVGCVETEASTWMLPLQARSDPAFFASRLSTSEKIDYEKVFTAAQHNDMLAGRLVHRSLLAWSSCVVNLIHAYDPELVIVGGGIMQSAEIILPFITKYVTRLAWTPWGKVAIRAAEHSDNAALLGISYLLADGFRTS